MLKKIGRVGEEKTMPRDAGVVVVAKYERSETGKKIR